MQIHLMDLDCLKVAFMDKFMELLQESLGGIGKKRKNSIINYQLFLRQIFGIVKDI